MKKQRGKSNSPNAGHRKRLRERFLKGGFDAFHDYEVVELLLTLGTPRKDCKQLARDVLRKFGTVRAVLEADTEELLQVKGIGRHNVFGLRLADELVRWLLKERATSGQKEYIRNSVDAFVQLKEYLRISMGCKKQEVFVVAFLDAKNRIISVQELFRGTVDRSVIYPREVLREAFANNAVSMIFAHNHPSGDVRPSEEDCAITRRLVHLGIIAGVRVLDHIIVGGDDYFSFSDEGLIEKYMREGGVGSE